MIAVWNRQREIEHLVDTAQFLASVDAKKAGEYFDKATALAFPGGGDIRALTGSEKSIKEYMAGLAGTAFKLTPRPMAGRRIRSHLREAQERRSNDQGSQGWQLKRP